MELSKVLFEKKDGIGFITINNIEKRNAIDEEVADSLVKCINVCDEDDDIRVIVLRGAGGNFSAGGDVKALKKRLDSDNPTKKSVSLVRFNDVVLRLKNIKKPTISYIEGAAAGAGASFAMSCDFSIAAETSTFVFAFANIGLIPDSGCTHLVTRAIGTVKATELFMLGKPFSGAQARDWGLITYAVPAEQLDETVIKLAKKLAQGPTMSYGYIKTMINRACFDSLEPLLNNEVEYQDNCKNSYDHKEGVTAFLEKRKPQFKGK